MVALVASTLAAIPAVIIAAAAWPLAGWEVAAFLAVIVFSVLLEHLLS
jgi:hypothetical protein